jgi:hypothetical protein
MSINVEELTKLNSNLAWSWFASLGREESRLVPRLAKSDELVLPATYHSSNVYDGCHSIFDKFIGGRYQ